MRGSGSGTTTDGNPHHGKLGPLGEPGYPRTPENEASRYRGKKGRSEIEVLGLVPYCTSTECHWEGSNITSVGKSDSGEETLSGDSSEVAWKEDASRTDTSEKTGANPGKGTVGSTNTPNLESATSGGISLSVGEHTSPLTKSVTCKHLSNPAN